MDVETVAELIHKRNVLSGRVSTMDGCKPLAQVLHKYQIEPEIRDFADPRGVAVRDQADRTVGVYPVEMVQKFLVGKGEMFSDVAILSLKGLLIGWVNKSQVVQSEGNWTTLHAQVRQLPDVFNFATPCPHLSVYGGIYDDDLSAWVCFGCDEALPEVVS